MCDPSARHFPKTNASASDVLRRWHELTFSLDRPTAPNTRLTTVPFNALELIIFSHVFVAERFISFVELRCCNST